MRYTEIYGVRRCEDGSIEGSFWAEHNLDEDDIDATPGIFIKAYDNGDLDAVDIVWAMTRLNDDLNENIHERMMRAQGQ